MTMLIQWAVTSSVLILAVILVRTLLGKRMGAGLRYALWAVVLLRLLIPVQLFSVPVPGPVRDALEPLAAQTAVPAPAYPPAGNGDPGAVVLTPATQIPGAVQEDTPPAVHDTPATPAAPTPTAPAPRPFDWQGALGWLWLAGGVAMGLALAVCNIRFAVDLRRRRRPVQTDCKLPVYAVEGLESPCLFGVVRPAVYVTPETAANPAMLRHVLAHETTHARHGDQVWSLLRCLALAVHWWNPLVWLAASLSRRDGELACDEGAIRPLGDGERKAYGWTLLTLITAQPSPVSLMNAATTMSGGKKALWERVRRIAHAQKRAVWAAALAVALAAAVTACAFSSAAAPAEEPGESPDPMVSASPEPADPGEESTAQPLTARQALYQALSRKEDIKFVYPNTVVTASVDDLRPITVNDNDKVRPEKFTVLDLNGDGEEEAVLWVDAGGWWTIVLCCEDGEVRGGCYYGRQFDPIDLRIDGTASNFDGAGWRGVGRICFPLRGGGYGVENVLYEKPLEGGGATDKVYTVNGETVTKAEYEAAYAAWEAQPDAVWYDFTQENLDALLGGAGDGLTALRTDLNRNGVPETLEVVEIDGGKRLRVMENGCCVWSEDGFYAHGGWNTLFLWRFEDHDWLLRYNPNMTTGSANHSYSLFCLTDGWQQVKDGAVTGEVTVRQTGAMEFDTNFTQAWYQHMDADAAARFLEELSPLLEDAQPLLNTNSELEDLHEQTGRWLTYPWDQYAPAGFAYDGSKSMEDNLRAWEEAGDPLCTLPVPPDPAAQIMPFAGSLNFRFCGGAGAWRTDLTLNGDGTFTGEFTDTDMGVPEEGYHTTRYICAFHGRFGDVEQVNDHAWSMTLAELTLDTGHPIGEEWIVDGTQYISSAPYGLSAAGADAPPEPGAKFMLYTPGATQKETGADEEFYWWLDMGPRMDFNCWALHNLATNYGFRAKW